MNKASGDDGIPVELFQNLKDDDEKVLHSICQQIWKLSSGYRTRKGQFSFQSLRKAILKNAQTTTQLYSSHKLWRIHRRQYQLLLEIEEQQVVEKEEGG